MGGRGDLSRQSSSLAQALVEWQPDLLEDLSRNTLAR